MNSRVSRFGLAAVSLMLLLATATLAFARNPSVTIPGTKGPDTLTGTEQRDVIAGFAGNDAVSALGGPDTVFAGRGDDTVDGGEGNDLLRGGFGNDSINAAGGNDRVFAMRGTDTVNGGDGNDRLWAMARRDVKGRGDQTGDILNGGNGNDKIRVRDGERDTVDCGEGFDRVIADRYDDTASNCERVRFVIVVTPDDESENQSN